MKFMDIKFRPVTVYESPFWEVPLYFVWDGGTTVLVMEHKDDFYTTADEAIEVIYILLNFHQPSQGAVIEAIQKYLLPLVEAYRLKEGITDEEATDG